MNNRENAATARRTLFRDPSSRASCGLRSRLLHGLRNRRCSIGGSPMGRKGTGLAARSRPPIWRKFGRAASESSLRFAEPVGLRIICRAPGSFVSLRSISDCENFEDLDISTHLFQRSSERPPLTSNRNPMLFAHRTSCHERQRAIATTRNSDTCCDRQLLWPTPCNRRHVLQQSLRRSRHYDHTALHLFEPDRKTLYLATGSQSIARNTILAAGKTLSGGSTTPKAPFAQVTPSAAQIDKNRPGINSR